MLVLAPPVPGPIERPFVYAGSPFARGLHRGIDLRARAGEGVVAPCGGTVAWAGPRGVTLICGSAQRRITLLPVRPAVRAGAPVRTGAPVGTVLGHDNLHLGVRRAGDPFGYVDPAPLLRRPRTPPPPVSARGPRGARPAPLLPRAAPRFAAPSGAASLAPPLAWGGLAVLLLGAVGGVRVRAARARRARVGAPRAVP